MSFENIVKKDIISFFESHKSLFLNESDMQIRLSVYLMQSRNYDDVNVEYFIPYRRLGGYLWGRELYIDIVVRKGDEYVAIELKYPTKKITESIYRFGEVLSGVPLLKEHSAQDIVQYNFWKDVRRLELLRKRFPSVKKGFAILVTNDMLYRRPRREGIACEQFSTAEGIHNKSRHWNNRKAWMDKGYPDFELDNEYAIEWNTLNYDGHEFTYEFIYCIVEV